MRSEGVESEFAASVSDESFTDGLRSVSRAWLVSRITHTRVSTPQTRMVLYDTSGPGFRAASDANKLPLFVRLDKHSDINRDACGDTRGLQEFK